MKKSKYPKYILFLLFATGGIFLALKIVKGIVDTNRAMNNFLPSSHKLRQADSLLIAEKYRDKMVVNEVKNSKARNPISLITYDNKYSLIIHQLGSVSQALSSNFFVVEKRSVDRTVGETYSIVNSNAFQFQYRIEKNQPFSQIYLTLHGDSIKQTLQNDSLFCFTLSARNLSVRYGENKPIDLFVKASKRSSGVPMSILFYRKQSSLYFLLLSPNSQETIDPQRLPSLVSSL